MPHLWIHLQQIGHRSSLFPPLPFRSVDGPLPYHYHPCIVHLSRINLTSPPQVFACLLRNSLSFRVVSLLLLHSHQNLPVHLQVQSTLQTLSLLLSMSILQIAQSISISLSLPLQGA